MAKEKDIIIANHHTGPIVLPRMYAPNTSGDPAAMIKMLESKTIQPGGTELLSATEWEIRKVSPALKYYLDNGHLSMVKRAGEVSIDTGATVDLEVPEHLQADQDGAVSVASKADGESIVKASIRSAKKSSITV